MNKNTKATKTGRTSVRKQITPKIPEGDIKRLDVVAKSKGLNRNDVAREAIRGYVNTQEALASTAPAEAESVIADDIARLHASLKHWDEGANWNGTPEFFDTWWVDKIDMEPVLALAESLPDTAESIPQVLDAYLDEWDRPRREILAACDGRPKAGSREEGLFHRWTQEWERFSISPDTGEITVRNRQQQGTLTWWAPGKIDVSLTSHYHPGLQIGWWLLLNDRSSAETEFARVTATHAKGYLSDYQVMRDVAHELDWIACVDDRLKLGGRALRYAQENLKTWLPEVEVTLPRRVRMYQLAQIREMAAAGIWPVLAIPTTSTVVVTTEQEALHQGMEYHPIAEEDLEVPPGWEWNDEYMLAEKLTQRVGRRGGATRYTAAYVRAWEGPKATMQIITTPKNPWGEGERWFQEEFPDGKPGAELLAHLAYPGAHVFRVEADEQ